LGRQGARTESGDGVLGDGAARPSPPARGLGSTVSSSMGVRGGAPATAKEFSRILNT